jgi:HEAT repeat protein
MLRDLASINYRVRWKAIQDLGKARDPRALEPLIGALNDRLPTIRIATLSALGLLRDHRAIEPVIAMLDDSDSKVRVSAAAALKKFGKAGQQPMLEAYRTGNAGTRFVLLGALSRLKSPEISKLLLAALQDPQDSIRLEAARIQGLRKEKRAAPLLLKGVARGGVHQFFYIQMLGEIGDPSAFEPLQTLLSTCDSMVGREVIVALRKIDNPRAVDLLYDQLENLPSAERNCLAHAIAGTDLLNAATGLARKARKSGDIETLRQAVAAVSNAQQDHRARTESLRRGEAPGQLDLESAGEAEGGDEQPSRVLSEAGLDVIRRLESRLRDLGKDH